MANSVYYAPGSVIFIRIPRTASGCIRNAFTETCGVSDHRPFKGLNKHAFGREAKARLPVSAWNDCRRFAVVRNPWQRTASMYRWFRHHRLTKSKFETWLRREPLHAYLNQMLPQTTWLTDDMEVFRFENLAEVAHEFGLTLEPINQSGAFDYREYYDDASREYVAALQADDIERFHYSF